MAVKRRGNYDYEMSKGAARGSFMADNFRGSSGLTNL